MEASAEGALEVVKAHDEDGRGCGAAAHGAAGGGDERLGVGGDVELGELCDRLAIVGDEEDSGVRGLALGAGEAHRDSAVAGDVRCPGRADGDGGGGRQLGLLAEQDFNLVLDGRRKRAADDDVGRGLRVAAEGGEGCGEEDGGETAKGRHS